VRQNSVASFNTRSFIFKERKWYLKGRRGSILRNSHIRCYKALDRRKQLGIAKEIMLYALKSFGPSGSRLFIRGLIKRSFIFRIRYRYWMGILNVAKYLYAGFGVFIVGFFFSSSFGGARFGSPFLSWSGASFDDQCSSGPDVMKRPAWWNTARVLRLFRLSASQPQFTATKLTTCRYSQPLFLNPVALQPKVTMCRTTISLPSSEVALLPFPKVSPYWRHYVVEYPYLGLGHAVDLCYLSWVLASIFKRVSRA